MILCLIATKTETGKKKAICGGEAAWGKAVSEFFFKSSEKDSDKRKG